MILYTKHAKCNLTQTCQEQKEKRPKHRAFHCCLAFKKIWIWKIHEKLMKSPDYFIFPFSYCFLAFFYSIFSLSLSLSPSLSLSLSLSRSCNVGWAAEGLNRSSDCLNGLKVDGSEVRRPGDEGIRKNLQGEEMRTHMKWELPELLGLRERGSGQSLQP